MQKKKLALSAAVAGAIAMLALPALTVAVNKPATKVANDGRATCYECHDEVKVMKEGSKHAKLACTVCHDKLDAHAKDPEKNKPGTVIDQALCGKCHKNQMESFYTLNRDGGARKEKGCRPVVHPCRTSSWQVTVSPLSTTNRAPMPSW